MYQEHTVKRFKSMAIGLKELAPFIRDGQHLLDGKPFESMHGLRSREVVANWLMCAVGNANHGADILTFSSDPTNGDGIIYNLRTGCGFETEHVMVTRFGDQTGSLEDRIFKAVAKKAKKGSPYAKGKSLIVFLDSGGEWKPVSAASGLPKNDFTDVWVVGLCGEVVAGQYMYSVSHMRADRGSPTWLVKLAADFGSWTVNRIQ